MREHYYNASYGALEYYTKRLHCMHKLARTRVSASIFIYLFIYTVFGGFRRRVVEFSTFKIVFVLETLESTKIKRLHVIIHFIRVCENCM